MARPCSSTEKKSSGPYFFFSSSIFFSQSSFIRSLPRSTHQAERLRQPSLRFFRVALAVNAVDNVFANAGAQRPLAARFEHALVIGGGEDRLVDMGIDGAAVLVDREKVERPVFLLQVRYFPLPVLFHFFAPAYASKRFM